LIDGNGAARLTDFGLLTISDSANVSASDRGGTTFWMSPELFDPELVGLADARHTESLDCYALGMVIYEVLSGYRPFHGLTLFAAPVKIVKGLRPERPQGMEGRWFTDEVWDMLGRCWKRAPSDRPSVEEVFECLDTASDSWMGLSSSVLGLQLVASPTITFSDP
jgi:serine/threonine protein kinase